MYFHSDSKVFLDGKWVNASRATASLYNQTLHYGYGVFDGMRSYKNAEGCNIFKAHAHFNRLLDAADKLKIELSYTTEELVNIAYQLLEKNGLQTAYIRPLVYLGPNMELTIEGTPHIFMGAWPWKKYLGHDPVDVMVAEQRKPTSETTPINGKIVGNYTNSILASSQAKKLGYHEAILLDIDGYVAEGPASNFFYERDGVLFTPTSKHALPGITRRTIMELARNWGIEVIEKNITLHEVYQADHAFFTGTASEVTPINSINGEKMKGTWEESHGHSLYMMYLQLVTNNEFQGLTIV
ncbi:MAG: branched-chain amino acid transaminase [Cyclobacteriaceae bacterium]